MAKIRQCLYKIRAGFLLAVTQITMQQTMRTVAFVCESCVFAYLGLALFSFPLRWLRDEGDGGKGVNRLIVKGMINPFGNPAKASLVLCSCVHALLGKSGEQELDFSSINDFRAEEAVNWPLHEIQSWEWEKEARHTKINLHVDRCGHSSSCLVY